MSTTANITRFQPEQRMIGTVNVIAGPRCTGKSTLAAELVARRPVQHYDDTLAFVGGWCDDFVKEYVTDARKIHAAYDDDEVAKFMTEAMDSLSAGRCEHRLLLLLDCFHDKETVKSARALANLIYTSRHYGVECVHHGAARAESHARVACQHRLSLRAQGQQRRLQEIHLPRVL